MELHYGGEMREDETSALVRGISPLDGLPVDLLDEMRSHTLVINELLRQFWSSYPVDSHVKAQRVVRVKDALSAQFER